MLALGIILVLLAGGVIVAALFGGAGQTASFDLGVVDVETNTLGVFLLGAGTLLLLVIGLGLIRSGLARARRRRQERKELNRLHRRLEKEQTTGTATSGTATTTGEQPAEGATPGPATRSDTPSDNPPPAR